MYYCLGGNLYCIIVWEVIYSILLFGRRFIVYYCLGGNL